MTSIRAILYNAAGHDEEIEVGDVNVKGLRRDQLLWIDAPLAEITALKALPKEIGQALSANEASGNLEIFDSYYRFGIPSLPKRKSSKNTGKKFRLNFIVGKSWLLTLSDPRPEFMNRFIEADQGETLNGRLTPSVLAVALLTELFDTYRCALSEINRAIDALDDDIFAAQEKRPPFDTLAILRREVSTLRAAMDESGNTIHALTRPDFFAHVDQTDHAYFEALGRTYDRMQDAIARARETVLGSFELYTTRVAQDTNQLVKTLTIATVITGIIGAVAGIFGMNFDTPFSRTGMTGFVYVILMMVVSSIAIGAVAIWRKWF